MSKTIYIEGGEYGYEDLKDLRHTLRSVNIFIDPCVEIGDEVELGRDVVIGKGCVIGDCVIIEQGSVLRPEVRVGDCVHIETDCTILSGARIAPSAHICEGITIGEDNVVEDVYLSDKFHIKGSVATVTYVGRGTVCIGCKHNHIDVYTDKYLDILGENYNYTPEQIEEYKGYIKQAREFINNINKDIDDRSSF